MDPTDEFLVLEHEGRRSLCEGTGDCFHGELMAEDGVMVLAGGSVLDREAVVASLDQAPTWDTYELSDARRVDTGPDSAAFVHYRAARHTGGKDGPRRRCTVTTDGHIRRLGHFARCSHRWRRGQGRPQLRQAGGRPTSAFEAVGKIPYGFSPARQRCMALAEELSAQDSLTT